jgi:methionyl-tRNA synthetase
MTDTQKNFYITTALPYVNGAPHVGFAMELVRADAVARFHRDILGEKVFFNTGTDEHGDKLYRKALEEGVEPQEYVDRQSEPFREILKTLNVSVDNFIRTTDKVHIEGSQEIWKRCEANGDIYKATYEVKYCVGCELEKTESELNDEGRCALHPIQEIEVREEENYYFRFSKYQDALLDLYKENPDFVVPDFRLNEIRGFVEAGLKDFSISRLKEKMPWGVEVPGDSEHVMYVWFDALPSYINALNFAEDSQEFKDFWPGVQYAGKDNLRQQSAIWQAMLLSAGLPHSKQIVINGFINGPGGVKMSKSLGNVIDPVEIAEEFGVDALRYYLLRELTPFEDGEFSRERFIETYNGNLANGLGNLVSRVVAMSEKIGYEYSSYQIDEEKVLLCKEAFEKYDLKEAMDIVWKIVGESDGFIQSEETYRKSGEEAFSDLDHLYANLTTIAHLLTPLLPDTSLKIVAALKDGKKLTTPLFLRVE